MIDDQESSSPLFHHYQGGIAAYRSNYERNMSPHQILLELYKGILKNLDGAKIAYRNKDLGKMCQYNQKNFLIISALKDHIDKSSHSKFAEDLDNFYTVIFYRLAKILNFPEPLQEFERLENSVKEVYQFWIRIGSEKISRDIKNFPEVTSIGTNFA